MDNIQKLKWNVLQPPYSLDLAPSDYHLFGSLREHLDGKRFCNNEEVIQGCSRVATLATKRLLPERHPHTSGPLVQVYCKPGRLCSKSTISVLENKSMFLFYLQIIIHICPTLIFLSIGAALGNMEGIRLPGLFEGKGQHIWVPFLDPEDIKILGNVVLRRKPQSTFCVSVSPWLHSDIHIWVPSFWTLRILEN
jgi:hypothetical protein